jgi:hypothetical protein
MTTKTPCKLKPAHDTGGGMLHPNFHEKALFVKADVAALESSATTLCPSPCFHPHSWRAYSRVTRCIMGSVFSD